MKALEYFDNLTPEIHLNTAPKHCKGSYFDNLTPEIHLNTMPLSTVKTVSTVKDSIILF